MTHQSPLSGLRPPPSTPLIIEASPSYTSVWVSWGVLFVVGFLVTLVALFALQYSRRAKRAREKEKELRKGEQRSRSEATKVGIRSKLLPGHHRPERSRSSGSKDDPRTAASKDDRRHHHHHRPSRSPPETTTSKIHPAYRDATSPSALDKHRKEATADVKPSSSSKHREDSDGTRDKDRSRLALHGQHRSHHHLHHHRSDGNRV